MALWLEICLGIIVIFTTLTIAIVGIIVGFIAIKITYKIYKSSVNVTNIEEYFNKNNNHVKEMIKEYKEKKIKEIIEEEKEKKIIEMIKVNEKLESDFLPKSESF